MEKGAYERARAFDTETIKRQDAEILELRAEVAEAKAEAAAAKAEAAEVRVVSMKLRERIVELERHNPNI
jgi:hypothetical protein